MRWEIDGLIEALAEDDATLYGAGAGKAPAVVTGVSIDSRSIQRGELFVALEAERDGHDFVASAAAAGASAAMVRAGVLDPARSSVPLIAVRDTQRALRSLGVAARARLDGHDPAAIVGVTGSVGKTSVKDLLKAIADRSGSAHANAASFNNELGVPLTLLGSPDDAEVVIVEMGARGAGHIAELCEIARPTVGIVTAVAAAHTELFGGLDEVAEAKSELVAALPVGGLAVLNHDDDRVLSMRKVNPNATVLTFGSGAGADVRVEEVHMDERLRPRFRLGTPEGTVPIELSVAGAHMATNAAAAAAAALGTGIGLDEIVSGLATSRLSPHRMDLRRADAGGTVINDAYNANPASMRAALEALARVPADRRIAVVGVMAELGPEGTEEHRRIAEDAARSGVRVIAVGAQQYGTSAAHVDGVQEAVAAVGVVGDGTAVLVKGSRVAGLERVAAALLGES